MASKRAPALLFRGFIFAGTSSTQASTNFTWRSKKSRSKDDHHDENDLESTGDNVHGCFHSEIVELLLNGVLEYWGLQYNRADVSRQPERRHACRDF